MAPRAPRPAPAPRRRTILRVIALLAAGAALNVAVAWGCVLRVPMDSMWTYGNVQSDDAWQPFHVLGIQREGFVSISQWRRFGSTHISILAGQHQRTPDTAPSGDPMNACPSWCRGRILDSLAHSERIVLVVEARGWPAYSLWTEPARMNVANKVVQPARMNVVKKVVQPARGGIMIDDRYAPGLDMYTKPTLPLIPILPGCAINTVFYAGVLWVLFCGPFALRRMIRRRRGQCAQCSYPIGQNERCTECGAAVTPTSKAINA